MIPIDALREMAKSMPSEHRGTIEKVVMVMMTLRSLDVEVIDHMLNLHNLTLEHMPDQLKPAFVGMITDLTMVKVFIEQAKTYDKTVEGEKAFESVFGKITPHGT